MDSAAETRRELFGDEKTAEVLLARDEAGLATAQVMSANTGIVYSLVRDALIRLATGGAVDQLPRAGGSRSALYYQPVEGALWAALTAAARAVLAAPDEHAHPNPARRDPLTGATTRRHWEPDGKGRG